MGLYFSFPSSSGSLRFEIVYFERFLRKAWRSFLTLRAGLTVWVKKSKVHASLLIKPGIPCNYSRGTMNMGSFSRILLAIMCLFDRFSSSWGFEVQYSSNSNSVPSLVCIDGGEIATRAWTYLSTLLSFYVHLGTLSSLIKCLPRLLTPFTVYYLSSSLVMFKVSASALVLVD